MGALNAKQIDAEDNELLRKVANDRDMGAFNTLFNRYRVKAKHLSYKILKSLEWADDSVQEAFISIWLHAKQFNFEAKVSSWIYRIVTNQAFMLLRKHNQISKNGAVSYLDSPDVAQKYFGSLDKSVNADIIDDSIHYRQVMKKALDVPQSYYDVLYYTALGYTAGEIEKKLGISRPAVKSRLFRARGILEKRIGNGFTATNRLGRRIRGKMRIENVQGKSTANTRRVARRKKTTIPRAAVMGGSFSKGDT